MLPNIGAQVWQSWPSALLLCRNPSVRKWQQHQEAGQCLLCTRAPWQAEGKFKWGSTGLIRGSGDICQICLKNKTLLSNVRLITEKAPGKQALADSLTIPCSWNHTNHFMSVEQLSMLQPLCLHWIKNVNFSKQHSWIWWSRAALAHRQNPSWF